MELNSPITSIDSNEYGHNFAVATAGRSVSIHSSQNLQKISEILNLHSTPYSIDYSSADCGNLLACGFSDGTVCIYQGNKEIKRFESQKGAILSVAFHPSKCTVAAASLAGTFGVYTKKGSEWNSVIISASLLGLSAITWAPDSDVVQTIIVGGIDGVIRAFKLICGNWELSAAAQVHNGWIRQLASPLVPIAGSQMVASCGDDNIVAISKLNGNGFDVSKIVVDFPACGISWAMVDKVLVLSNINGEVTMWTEDENGNWKMEKQH
ncbi:protein transport protein SEC13 B [Histomonas meleagridis]|uniref:protein transport protein SEC13-like B n=1 Tax=Histomonas meleagridis TaxID=135588 RepID=UPI00355AB548|nr:protein transport protein SEC13 B [Histomonas meleagridis]KAH0806018.1 protein transport protein SEC13-like B [Histomonas meleagridis]